MTARRAPLFLRRALVLAGAVLASLAAGEVALRIAGIAPPRPYALVGERANRASAHFAACPVLGWRMKPSHAFTWETEGRTIEYRADAQGFRVMPEADRPDRGEHSDAADPLVRRVVFAGDSFTWGMGVPADETFAARVAASLEAACINLGLPGFGIDQVWRALEAHGFAPRPDLAVVALYPEDFERSLSAFKVAEGFAKPAFVLDGGTLRVRTAADRPHPLARLFEERSHLFTAGRRAWQLAGRYAPAGDWWRLNAALLDAIADACAARGVPLLVVHVPDRTWRPFPQLGRHLARRGIAYVDPLALAEGAPAGAYFATDSHLSPAGHRWFADRILDRARQMAPPRSAPRHQSR